MRYAAHGFFILMFVCATRGTAFAAPTASQADAVIAEATSGQFKARKGSYFEPACNQKVDYDAEVVDLNGDGQPEVLTNVHGTCMGGGAGVHTNLYIKNKNGKWEPQFGFPGIATVLKSKNRGYPDIEIGGPGNCFPVWRWNGKAYAMYKTCRR